MKKTLITRAFSILFTLVMVISLMAPVSMITASAATEENSASSSVSYLKINLPGKNFYMVKDTAVLRSSTSIFYSKLATFEKSSIIETSGSTGDFYKVSMKRDGKTVTGYVKKSELKGYVSSVNAKFCYTNKKAALRQAPFDNGDKVNIEKGNVLYIVSNLKNSHNNKWVGIFVDGHIRYMFVDNIVRTEKITVSISGPAFIKTGSNANFKCTVSPSAISGIKVTCSDTGIATVNSSGVVTPKAGGSVKLTVSLPGLVSASINTNIALNVKPYFQTENYTCSAASTIATLRYLGKAKDVKDVTLYKKSIDGGYVYKIRDTLNSYLGKNTYCWETFTDIGKYEKAISKSLSKNYPVIVRVSFPKEYFNYKSSGHITTVTSLYEKDGQTWAICIDSYVNRHDSNSYSNSETGEVHVPLEDLYYYNSYEGRDSRYVIFVK